MRRLCIVLPMIALGCSVTDQGDVMSTRPIACSLSPEDLRDCRDALLPGLIHRADKVTDLDNGLRLEFKTTPGMLTEIARVMEQERGCCTFLRFNLTAEAEDGPISFDVAGPKGTREVLRFLLRLQIDPPPVGQHYRSPMPVEGLVCAGNGRARRC